MKKVFWLEQTERDLPPRDDWLSAAELQVLSKIEFPKRRRDWRLGRWTAKRAVRLLFGKSVTWPRLCELEIRAGPLGEPQALFQGQPAAISLSISHREGSALCALARDDTVLGCDLEIVESHSDAFVADYFTEQEQTFILATRASYRPFLVSLLWSAKESALKALHQGLRLDTRTVSVHLGIDGELVDGTKWLPFRVDYRGCSRFRGCWSCNGDLLRTLVIDNPSLNPLPIHLYAECVPAKYLTSPAQERSSYDELTNPK